MGQNDYHVTADGSLARGLTTTTELQGVVGEIDSVDQAEAILETLREQLTTLRYKELPMLKGKGFVVVNPVDGRFTGEEHDDFDDAKNVASNLSYSNSAGYAIVYAPVVVLRPKREAAESTPSNLLKQIGVTGVDKAKVAEIAAPDEAKG